MKSPALQEKSKQFSWQQWLIMEDGDEMFPCNIDPFSEDIQASWKRPPKPPPEERMKSPAPQAKSKQSSWRWWLIMEEDDEMFPCNIDPFSEDIQASWNRTPKPPPEERMKSPAPQEKSKQSSQQWRLIMEEDDKIFPCNIDPFSEELVY